MSDLFNLAERIVNYVREGGDRPYGTYEVVVVERILREAWEGGGQAKNDEHSADKAEGTSVTFSPDSTAAKGTSSQAAAPAALDPHEFTPWRDTDFCGCSHRKPNGAPCLRPADDPIHEVKDDNARLDNSGAAVPGGAEADVLDSGQDTPVTVGPGDEVTRGGQIYDIVGRDKRGQAWGVLMLTCACVPLVPIESFRTLDGRPVSGFREPRAELVNAKDSVLLGQRIVELEKYVVELEGRPVMQTEWEQQQARIAELEQELRGARRLREIAHEAGTKLRHERDEARAERDVLLSGASKQAVRERELGWVRLDDETIEKVAWVMFALDNAGPHHRYLHDKLRHCLRELRDGELGGGE